MGSDDSVNHPRHYGGDVYYETIKIIEDWGLGFSVGNALKYVLRAPHKGDEKRDLEKARWYLRRAVDIREHMSERRTIERHPLQVSEYWKLSEELRDVVFSIRFFDIDAGLRRLDAHVEKREAESWAQVAE